MKKTYLALITVIGFITSIATSQAGDDITTPRLALTNQIIVTTAPYEQLAKQLLRDFHFDYVEPKITVNAPVPDADLLSWLLDRKTDMIIGTEDPSWTASLRLSMVGQHAGTVTINLCKNKDNQIVKLFVIGNAYRTNETFIAFCQSEVAQREIEDCGFTRIPIKETPLR